jgi:tetratricopeptide (TPR) repeat protein
MRSIEELIEDASHDMYNPVLNFEIAEKYNELNQTASAVSFYLRAAEYGVESHPLIVYTSLLKMSICFNDQRDRNKTVLNNILQAIAHVPTRPEAYFFLSRYYEQLGSWQECYTMACVGLEWAFDEGHMEPLPADVEYHGPYVLTFEKAVSSWWIGRQDESRALFKELDLMELDPKYRASVESNLSNIL